MIRVSRLDGSEFVVNAELIQVVERTPDTVLTLLNGDKFVVREPLDEVLTRVIAYQRQVHSPEPQLAAPDHRVPDHRVPDQMESRPRG